MNANYITAKDVFNTNNVQSEIASWSLVRLKNSNGKTLIDLSPSLKGVRITNHTNILKLLDKKRLEICYIPSKVGGSLYDANFLYSSLMDYYYDILKPSSYRQFYKELPKHINGCILDKRFPDNYRILFLHNIREPVTHDLFMGSHVSSKQFLKFINNNLREKSKFLRQREINQEIEEESKEEYEEEQRYLSNHPDITPGC